MCYLNSSVLLVASIYRYYAGSHIFPDVLLNDIAGPDGDPLLLSLKLAVDVLVSIMFTCVSSPAYCLNIHCLTVRVVLFFIFLIS